MYSRKNVLLMLLVFTCAQVFDLGTTYIQTPDLSKEINPIVTHLSLGWGGVVVLKLSVIALIFLLLLLSFKHRQTSVPEPGLSTFSLFMKQYYLGKNAPTWQIFISNPKDLQVGIKTITFCAFSIGLALSVVAGVTNLLYKHTEWFKIQAHAWVYINLIGSVLIGITSFLLYLWLEYKCYLGVHQKPTSGLPI